MIRTLSFVILNEVKDLVRFFAALRMTGIVLWIMLLPAVAHADMEITVKFDNKERTAWVALPDNFNKFKVYPTVIALHGGGGNAEQFREQTAFDELGDKEGFIAVYPNGTPALGQKLMTWNAGDCCGKAQERDVDDVRFLDVLIDTVIRQYHADPKRIYMTGHSNGAMMTYRYTCVHPERLAAIAPNAGQEWYRACTETKRPVPILHIHGTDDQCANYTGGEACGGCFKETFGPDTEIGKRACYPVPENMKMWADRYGCNPTPVHVTTIGAVTCEAWRGCKGGSDVSFCRVEGAGHSWPGRGKGVKICETRPNLNMCKKMAKNGGAVNYDIDATSFIWNYFSQHSMP